MAVLGDAFLFGALALAAAGAASGAYQAITGSAAAGRRARVLGRAAAWLAAVAWAALLLLFLSRDYTTYVVWAYSDEATPTYLRAAGTWAGAAGSVLSWAALVGGCIAVEETIRRRTRAAESRLAATARAIALAAFAVLLVLAVQARPFAPTVDFHFDAAAGFFTYQPGLRELPNPLHFRPEGFGLNPLLLTPFMAVHPPMEFLAYAATTLVFAYAAAHVLTKDKAWWAPALMWARVAWLFFALALGLGALWAYYVLSFGGYWAWDPVEVGDLVPFLGLTALLHAVDLHRKGKGYPHYAPLLAVLVFPLVLFGTFVTRSSYWISAHAFDVGTSAIIVDPAARLVAIAGAKPQVGAFLALLLVVLAAAAGLYLARFLRDVAWPRRRALAGPALLLLGAYALLALLAALDVGAFLRGALGVAEAAGGGDLLLGLAVLGLALVGAPAVLFIVGLEDEAEGKPLRAGTLLEPDTLMSLGVVLLSLGLLVTLAILLVGVNFTVDQLGETFRARLPLVALPLVLVLTLRLAVKTLGARRSAALALGAFAAGGLLFLTLPEAWRLFGLGVPVLGVALGAGVNQLLRAAAKNSPATTHARRAGALMLLASLTGFAMWASPPTGLALGPWSVRVPLALVPLGLGASMASYVLGVLTAQGAQRRHALLGGLAAVLTLGYGVGLALGLGALVLAWRARDAPPDATLGAALARVRGRLHGTSRWAAHVGILLVLAGYGASGYHATEAAYTDLAEPLERLAPRAFGPYTLTLADSAGKDLDGDGTFEEVTALVAVRRGSTLLDLAPVTLYWVEKEAQYRPTEHVVRQPLEDLYLNSDPRNLPAFHTGADGWVASGQAARFTPGGEPAKFRSDEVDRVALSVKALPLVAPLWAGAAMLPFTMAVALLTAPPREPPRPLAAAAPAPAPQPAVPLAPPSPGPAAPSRSARE